MLARSSVPFLVSISFILGVLHPTVVRALDEYQEAAAIETANNTVKHCAAGTKEIYRDTIYTTCYSTHGVSEADEMLPFTSAPNVGGDGCDVYFDNPSSSDLYYCGQFNTGTFQHNTEFLGLCCACPDGGNNTPSTAPTAPNTSSSIIPVPPSTSPNVLINAMEDAIAGIISSKDPLECMTRYDT